MSDYYLIVSDPPHGTIDLATAVACFGLTRAEVQMKANYGLPEIWFAGQDRQTMETIRRALREAGLRVVLLSGEALRSLPFQSTVSEFTFTEERLDVVVDGDELSVPYDESLTGVLCRPQRETASASRPSRATALGRLSHSSLTPDALVGRTARGVAGEVQKPDPQYTAFVDFYLPDQEAVRRIAFSEGTGAPETASAEKVAALATVCEKRFPSSRFDRRAEGMRIRRRILVGEYPDDERRRGYSFATRALSILLETLSPGLKRVTQAELASRLAFLTLQSRAQ